MTTIATKYPFIGSIDTKQGGRSENQDNAGFVDTPLGLLLVVCDGMGGGPGGRTASLIAVDTILSVLSDVSEHISRENALKYAIEKANDVIYSKAKETPVLRGMGTTVAALFINEVSAVIAHVGDTRVYQLRKGTIVFRSSDHSVVANLVRQGTITEEEARNNPQSNIITRALGIKPDVEIEFDEVTFQKGDRFVLCTDGIWGMMPQLELVKQLSRVMGIAELIYSMTGEIDRIGHENGGNHDNMTLAVVDTTFESTRKKIKKNNSSATIRSDEKKIGSFHKKRNKIIFFVLMVIVVYVSIFLIHNQQGEGFVKEKISIQRKGETTTTINPRMVLVRKDNYSHDSVYTDTQVSSSSQNKGTNPFSDSNIKEEEVTHVINNIKKNLDSLKVIKGRGNKIETMQKKFEFVKKVIAPDVKRLEKNVVNEKKKDLGDIIKMLNDRKIVSCDKSGNTTKEGLTHIDEIKRKLGSLQN